MEYCGTQVKVHNVGPITVPVGFLLVTPLGIGPLIALWIQPEWRIMSDVVIGEYPGVGEGVGEGTQS